MSNENKELFETTLSLENKDVFVELKQNSGGVYLKLTEKNKSSRNTVLIPFSGIDELKKAITSAQKVGAKITPTTSSTGKPERKPRVASDPEAVSRSIYVSGLAWETTEAALLNHFKKAGAISKATILTRTRGEEIVSRGCGTVEFKNANDAKRAVKELGETELDGRTIKCREERVYDESSSRRGASAPSASSAPREKREKRERTERAPRERKERVARPPRSESAANKTLEPTKLFVTSLAWETTADDLSSLFGAIGDVINCEILQSKKGRSLGHAVVEFSHARDASEAIERMNGKELDGRNIATRAYYTFSD